MKDILDLLARFFISFIFLAMTASMLSNFDRTVDELIGNGWELLPKFFIVLSIVGNILGGALILLGYRVKLGAVILMIFLIPATMYYHNFWDAPDGEQQAQLVSFMKNMAIFGGLLMVAAYGSGKYSIKRLFATTKIK